MKILAKSTHPKLGDTTLVTHTKIVTKTACEIIDLVGDYIIKALSLNCSIEYLRKTVIIAAICHDIGKANSHFQRFITDTRCKYNQALRHEYLSAYAMMILKSHIGTKALEEQYSFHAAMVGAIGHHLKDSDRFSLNDGYGRDMIFYGDHPEVATLLRSIERELDLKPNCLSLPNIGFSYDSYNDVCNYVATADPVVKKRAKHNNIFYSAVRSLVILADSLGSATMSQPERKDWLHSVFKANILTPEDIGRIKDNILGEGREPFKFQLDTGKSKAKVTILTASTGSGKTLAIIFWALCRACYKKLFILLPQRGISAQMYLDNIQGNIEESSFVCSGADIILDILTNATDNELEASSSIYRQEYQDEMEEKRDAVYGMESIIPKIICGTTHFLMGLLQNSRKGLITLSALCNSAVVVDEAHAGGAELFEHIIKLIETLDVPFLIMSATLTPKQIQRITEAANGDVNIIGGIQERENLGRYVIDHIGNVSLDDLVDRIVEEANTKNPDGTPAKVMVVANTVAQCQALHKKLEEKFPHVHIYHSQFNAIDRYSHQKKLVSAFRGDESVIAVTTQVCEMSLDISCDVMFTQECPVSGFIQRLGRNNRYGKNLGRCYIFSTNSYAPYDEQKIEIDLFRDAINGLILNKSSQPISQSDLNKVAIAVYEQIENQENPDVVFHFLHPSIYTKKSSVANYESISVIPTQYIDICKQNKKNREKYSVSLSIRKWGGQLPRKIRGMFYYCQPDYLIYDSDVGMHQRSDYQDK